jgi:hypothetical protein
MAFTGMRAVTRIPDDWLILPALDGQFNEPRHSDDVKKQFMLQAEKILGFPHASPFCREKAWPRP